MPVDLDRDDSIGIWTPHPHLAKGTWKDGDEWYKIRPLSPAALKHFEHIAGKIPQVDPKTHQVSFVVNEDRKNELMYDHVLEEWRITTTKGVVWPCNLENKVKLADRYADRVNWIIATAIEYGNNDEAREEAERVAFQAVGPEEARPAVAELPRVSVPSGVES